MRRVAGAVAVLLVAACTGQTEPTPPVEGSTTEVLAALDGEPCPDSDFTCVTLDMPLDQFDESNDSTIQVTFAVLPATGESKGAFFTATGGPGTAGILSADSYTSALDPAIPESFDIVFFDQRGVGMSGGLTCPAAALELYRADADVSTQAGRDALAQVAATFSADCIREMGDPEILPYLSTAQVVEDIEDFRATLGFEEFVLYGESYGTQVAQTFAAAHPDSVDRLLLDGTVDLTLEGFTFYGEQAAAFAQTLDETLETCAEDEACLADFGDDPEAVYDRLAALLAEDPVEVGFPLPNGSTATRELTLTDLEVVASGQMYAEDDRMLFLRALAAYSGRQDLVPLLRLLYPNLGVDPTDESIIEDPSWSDAIYYGVECLDYNFPGATPDDVVQAFFEAGADHNDQRLGSIFYGDLPCAFWPDRNTSEERPGPLTAEGIPTLVMGATADPATPYTQGASVWERLDEGSLITQNGGPHVIFGRGNPCPDTDGTAFILDGTPPTSTSCTGQVVDPYLALMPASIDDFDSAESMFDSVEWELGYLPEYYYWDGVDDTGAGCNLGGSVGFTSTDVGYGYELEDCVLAEDLALTGTGSYDVDNDIFTLQVQVGSPECVYRYERAGDEVTVDDQCPGDAFES